MTVKQAQTDRITYLGISMIGESHIKSSKQNQDAIEFFALGDSFVIAVSDGLGSYERSQIGSQTAVLICSRMLLEIEDDKLNFECDSLAQRLIELWTYEFPKGVSKNYSATIKAVFARGNEFIVISIGDGLLYILMDGEMHHAPNSENEFLNESACLSHSMNRDELWTKKISNIGNTLIFICTDGVSSGISEGRERELIREIAAKTDFSELTHEIEIMIDEISKYNSDDKTVGVVKL